MTILRPPDHKYEPHLAKARTNGHRPCREPAMANGRCRLHGGKCTGPKTEEGKKQVKVANTKHGFYTSESMQEKLYIQKIIINSRV